MANTTRLPALDFPPIASLFLSIPPPASWHPVATPQEVRTLKAAVQTHRQTEAELRAALARQATAAGERPPPPTHKHAAHVIVGWLVISIGGRDTPPF